MVKTLFDEVVGHRQVIDLLAAEAESPSHAYLFVGPSGVGKATVARRFAALLLCEEDAPCIARVLSGVHPDLSIVEPEGAASLTVGQARDAVARAVLAPVEASRKVFLFEEAGAMTEGAANTLLKTLEEPTETTIFILVAESEDELPATIASRSRTVLFSRVPEADIASALVGRGIAVDHADTAATSSGGRPGIALLLGMRPEVAAFRTAWLGVPIRLGSDAGIAFRLAEELVHAVDPLLSALVERQEAEQATHDAEGVAARRLKDRHERERKRAASSLHVAGLEILASWYRDAAAAQHGAPIRNRDVSGSDLADVSARDAVARAERVLECIESLEANQRPELAFAALFSDLAARG
jgi:DNA polymerase-3 subunit delta'